MFSNIDINFFFVNKNFNSYIFFKFNNTKYVIVRERFKTVKAEDINDIRQYMFKYIQQNLYKACKTMCNQINKHKKTLIINQIIKLFCSIAI